MPVDDAEPRYQFADPDGNVIGSIYFDDASNEARLAFDDGTEVVLGTPTQVGSSTTPGVFESVSAANQLGIPVYSDDANAPSETQYFNDSDTQLKYKDFSGTVYSDGSSSGSGGRTAATFYIYNDAGTYRVLDNTGTEVSSGSDIATQLQYAVDNLSASGGTIWLAAAEYTTSGGTVSWDTQNNVKIQGEVRGTGAEGNFVGEGSGGVKIKQTGNAPLFDISSTGTDSSSKIYFELEDLYLYGPGSNTAIEVGWSDQFQVTRCFIQNWDIGLNSGVEGRANAYNVVQTIFIENSNADVFHERGNKPQFYDSKFLNSGGDGIVIDATVHTPDINKGIITGCDFHNNGALDGTTGHGVVTNGDVNLLVITGNVFDGGTGDGVRLESGTTESIVGDNYFDQLDGWGINLIGGNNAAVGNIATANGSGGIRTDDRSAVISNVSDGNTGTDIVVDTNADGAVLGSNVNGTRTINGTNTKFNGTTFVQSSTPNSPKTFDLWVDIS